MFFILVVLQRVNITKSGMKGFINSITWAWGDAWKKPTFRISFLSALLTFSIFPWKASTYFQWIQQRQGLVLHDYILEFIPSKNVSYPIFSIIYCTVIYLIIRLLASPKTFLWFAWAFNLETAFRFLTIFLVALNPPLGIVDLHDPIASLFIYGENMAITKDLFFSGHTATMVFACYFLPQKKEKITAIISTLVLVGLLLVQHVHYTIDIIMAPLFTLMSIGITKAWTKN
jgi:hypothetical protein